MEHRESEKSIMIPHSPYCLCYECYPSTPPTLNTEWVSEKGTRYSASLLRWDGTQWRVGYIAFYSDGKIIRTNEVTLAVWNSRCEV